MSIVYTTGVFDLLHPGHLSTLKRAADLGKLIVGVQDDESVFLQKGQYPAMSCEERIIMLKSLPFVNSVLAYNNVDQREMLDKIKPDIMVQTEEWITQCDRTQIINYLKKNRIRLVLLPIKKLVSSTEIKNRVIKNAYAVRNDVGLLIKSLKIVEIDKIVIYEMFDPKRLKKLVEKIKKDRVFYNPIIVVKTGKKFMVIDGVNRLQALKELGMKKVFVHVIDYEDIHSVELSNNAHFLNITKDRFLSFLRGHNINYEKIHENLAIKKINLNEVDAVCKIKGECYMLSSAVQQNSLPFLNRLVSSYLNAFDVYRLSELSQDEQNFPVKIIFRTFGQKEIINIVKQNAFLNSGITWHKIKNSIVRFRVPLNVLCNRQSIKSCNAWLVKEIEQKIKCKDIRYYPSNIYICDEWT